MLSKSNFINRVLLLLVLIIGGILRFYNYSQIPFTHDEFSALFRMGFTDFDSLIKEGVLVDFHPAGVQVFLNYYGYWFGEQEWILKLPFTLFGMGSIYLSYQLGKIWFNERTGLLAAAFLSCTQFFVFYSQIARPYSAGLFFGLLAILHWHKFVFSGKSVPLKNLLAWVIFASVSSYIHYYLLLGLVITGGLGLILCPKERRPLYILSGILIFIFYLPHLQIFLHQSSKGGIGSWLGPPDFSFFLDFASYLGQYSLLFSGFCVLMIILGFALNPKAGKNWWIAMGIFCLSLLAGFFYSILINPILQFSGLLFSTPFLIVALLYWASLNKWVFRISFLGILGMGSYSLIFEREHYSIFYQSPYEYLVKDLKASMKSQDENTLAILNDRKDILLYYLDKYEIDSNSIILAEHKPSAYFEELFANSKADKLFLGAFASSPPELLAIAQKHFPNLELRNSYFLGEYFVFSRNGKTDVSTIFKEEKLEFSNENKFWKQPPIGALVSKDSIRNYLKIDKNLNYNPSFEIVNPKALHPSSNIFVDLKLDIELAENRDGIFVVLSLESNAELITWYAKPLEDFMKTKNENRISIIHSLAITDRILSKENLKLKGFLYKKEQVEYHVLKASFQLRNGNPKLYSLFTKMGN